MHTQETRATRLELRVERLESEIRRRPSRPDGDFSNNQVILGLPAATDDRNANSERMFFKGIGLRSEFFGASNPWSFISEASNFTYLMLSMKLIH